MRTCSIAATTRKGASMLPPFAFRSAMRERGEIKIRRPANGYWTSNRNNPEECVAYDELLIRDLYARNGLSFEGPIHFGSWCGRRKAITQQDVVVARKTQAGCSYYPRVRFKRRLGHFARRLLHGPLQRFVWRGVTIEHVERARSAVNRDNAA
jgi:hypothetical protein